MNYLYFAEYCIRGNIHLCRVLIIIVIMKTDVQLVSSCSLVNPELVQPHVVIMRSQLASG